jgi:phosphoribosylamine-glycine ligase
VFPLIFFFAVDRRSYKAFRNFEMCQTYIEACDYPVVVKASGLAAGKGVIIPRDKAEAIQAAREMLVDKKLGESGAEVVVEELIEGEEISVLAFCDGKIAVGMPPAQDHKRIFDNDQGPNTGGMGAYAPAPGITKGKLYTARKLPAT